MGTPDLCDLPLSQQARLLGNGISLVSLMAFFLYVFAHTVRMDEVAKIEFELPFKPRTGDDDDEAEAMK